jgi:hypothetical protein
MGEPLFATQRRSILEAYQKAGQAFSASTKPYKSTVAFSFQGANTITASSVRWLIARPGQRFEWFGYKIADQVPGDPPAGGYRPATEADTNLSKARTTNGAEDFVIEGISASCRSVRLSYATADGGAGNATALGADLTDSDVILAVNGRAPIMDPGALYAPPQVQSPFNLENALYRALSPHIAVEFEWDRNKVVKIGTLEQIPEGGANSYLRASGEPSTNDRYRVPEGYLWRREGQPDSEFIPRGTVTEPVCLPILSVSLPSSVTVAVATVGRVWLDVLIRLHGLSVKIPSRN